MSGDDEPSDKLPAERSSSDEQSGEAPLPADPEDIEELLDDLPEEKARVFRAVIERSYFSGPLPRASDLQAYEDVLTGAAERIFALTEKEQAHRHQWENTELQGEISYSRLGLWLGTGALVAVIVGVVACAYFGQPWAAAGLSALGLGGIVSALVKGRQFFQSKDED